MYKLLEVGERVKKGDDIFNLFEDKWEPLTDEDLSDGEFKLKGGDFPHRRKINTEEEMSNSAEFSVYKCKVCKGIKTACIFKTELSSDSLPDECPHSIVGEMAEWKQIPYPDEENNRDHCGCGSQKYLSNGRHHYAHDHSGFEPK